jgi:hypothetical protein
MQTNYVQVLNKYTGMLRVFVLMLEPVPSDGRALIEIRFTNSSPRPATLDLLSTKPYRNALDERIDFQLFPDQPTITVGNEYISTPNYWVTADFPMNYDPCTCNAQSRLLIKVWILQSSTLTFKTTGTQEQVLELDKVGINNSQGGKHTLIKQGQLAVEAGVSGYKTAESGKEAINTILNKLGVPGLPSFVADGIIPGLGFVLGVTDFIIGLGKKKEEPPKPLVFKMNLESSGGINSDQPSQQNIVNNPGSYQAYTSTELEPIHYNNTMGVFNLLRKPKVLAGYGEVWDWIYCGEICWWYQRISATYSFQLSENIQFLLNPASGLKLSGEVEAAYIFEFEKKPIPYTFSN